MKKYILNNCMKSIKKSYPDYSEEKLLEIKYGLEGLYLTITKGIVIFALALILGIFKEMIIILLLYNILRAFGFGLHATKSWICLIFSITIFIGTPYIASNIIISIPVKIILIIVCITCFYLYAPADTKKHPLIKKKKRYMLKIIVLIISMCYAFMCLYIKNQFISNAFLAALIIETILVIPITYKLFNLSYNNYKEYLLNN